MIYKIIILPFLWLSLQGFSQPADTIFTSIFTVNKAFDIPLTIGLSMSNYIGLRLIDQKSSITEEQINTLDVNDINFIDRPATRQDYSSIYSSKKISDIAMNVSLALPALLMLKKEVRSEWAELLLIYLKMHAINGNIFSWGAAMHIDRIRPIVYHPEATLEEKQYMRNKNSFYSGHVSTTAASTFFMAAVLENTFDVQSFDKLLLYSAAMIPTIIVGIFRYKAMKHFPTDIITGFIVGAASGILTPRFHLDQVSQVSMILQAGQISGITLKIHL